MHGITWPCAHAGVWARQCKLLLSKLCLHSQSNRNFSRVYCNPTFYQVLVKQLSRRLWTQAYSSYQVYTPFHFYECPETNICLLNLHLYLLLSTHFVESIYESGNDRRAALVHVYFSRARSLMNAYDYVHWVLLWEKRFMSHYCMTMCPYNPEQKTSDN